MADSIFTAPSSVTLPKSIKDLLKQTTGILGTNLGTPGALTPEAEAARKRLLTGGFGFQGDTFNAIIDPVFEKLGQTEDVQLRNLTDQFRRSGGLGSGAFLRESERLIGDQGLNRSLLLSDFAKDALTRDLQGAIAGLQDQQAHDPILQAMRLLGGAGQFRESVGPSETLAGDLTSLLGGAGGTILGELLTALLGGESNQQQGGSTNLGGLLGAILKGGGNVVDLIGGLFGGDEGGNLSDPGFLDSLSDVDLEELLGNLGGLGGIFTGADGGITTGLDIEDAEFGDLFSSLFGNTGDVFGDVGGFFNDFEVGNFLDFFDQGDPLITGLDLEDADFFADILGFL